MIKLTLLYMYILKCQQHKLYIRARDGLKPLFVLCGFEALCCHTHLMSTCTLVIKRVKAITASVPFPSPTKVIATLIKTHEHSNLVLRLTKL